MDNLGQKTTGFSDVRLKRSMKLESALVKDNVLLFKRKIENGEESFATKCLTENGISRSMILNASTEADAYAKMVLNIFYAKHQCVPGKLHDLVSHILKSAYTATKISVHFNDHLIQHRSDWQQFLDQVVINIDQDLILKNITLAYIDTFNLEKQIHEFFTYIRPNQYNQQTIYHTKIKNACFSSNYLGCVRIVFNRDVCFIQLKQCNYLLPYNYIQQIHNKIHDLFSVTISSHFLDSSTLTDKFHQKLYTFIHLLCNLFIREKDNYFDFVNGLESLAIAISIVRNEKWDNYTFWNNLMENLKDVMSDFNYCREITSFLETLHDAAVSELCCTGKLLGHPIILIDDAVKKLVSRTFNNPDEQVDLKTCDRLRNLATLEFIEAHIDRHKVWPSCAISEDAPYGLKIARNNSWKLTSRAFQREYNLSPEDMMKYVNVLKCLDFVNPSSMIENLKDKAISMTQSRIFSYYLKCHEDDIEKSDKLTSSQKQFEKRKFERLILQYVLTEDADGYANKFFEYITHRKYHSDFLDSDGNIIQSEWLTPTLEYQTDDEHISHILGDLVIKCTPKEKELKTKARLFGSLSTYLRSANQVIESNIADWLTKNTSYQTLKLTETDMLRKLSAFASQRKLFRDHYFFMISFDASAWCSKWRDTVIEKALEIFDKAYGIKCYTKRMEMFENSMIYVTSPAGVYVWNGQAGGIEGLGQYSWTYCYHQQAKLGIEGLFEYQRMLIKGDDLRISLVVHPNQMKGLSPSEFAIHIMETFSSRMKDMGHTIKVKESYCSSQILVFSKTIYNDGASLPNSLRKTAKIMGSTRASIDTVEDAIGSTFSNAHSAGPTTYNPIGLYFTSCVISACYLKLHEQFSKLTINQTITALLVPGVLGGFPVLMFHNMLVREESDHLSSAISLYQFLVRYYRDIADIFCAFIHAPKRELSVRTYTTLYMDPYAINTTIPIGAMAYLRQSYSRLLPRISRNKQIKEICNLQYEMPIETLTEALLTNEKWVAKIFSLLFMATPTGIICSLSRQFESCKTMFDALGALTSPRLARAITRNAYKQDAKRNKWRLDRLQCTTVPIVYPDLQQSIVCCTCPTLLAEIMRKQSWGREILTVTNPPLQHLITLVSDVNRRMNDRSSSFEVRIHENLKYLYPNNPSHLYMTRTDATIPFYGSTTSSKISEPTPIRGLNLKNCLITVLSIILEIDAFSRPLGVDNDNTRSMSIILEKLMNIYIKDGAKILNDFRKVLKAGCAQHRLQAPKYKRSIQLNVSPNIYNRVDYNTNSHQYLRGSIKNYAFNILGIYAFSVSLYHLELQFKRKLTYDGDFLIKTLSPTECVHCWKPIEDPILNFRLDDMLLNNLNRIAMTNNLQNLNIVSETLDELNQNNLTRNRWIEGFSIPRQNFTNVNRDQMESICAKAILTLYLSKITSNHEAITGLTKHKISLIGLELMDPLVNPSAMAKILHVKHWRRIADDEIATCMIEQILQTCFSLSAVKDPVEWLKNDLVVLGPNFSPWLLCIRDLQDSRIYYDFLKYISDITRKPLNYHILTNHSTACGYINECLGSMIMENIAIFPEIYYTNNESPDVMYSRLQTKQSLILWQKIMSSHNKTLIHSSFEEILEFYLPYFLPIKNASDIVDLLTYQIDEIEFYIIDWPVRRNGLLEISVEEEDFDNLLQQFSEKIKRNKPAIMNSNRFHFIRSLMSANCQSKVDGVCQCINRFFRSDMIDFVDTITTIKYIAQKYTILHIDAASCLAIVEGRSERVVERLIDPIIELGLPYSFRNKPFIYTSPLTSVEGPPISTWPGISCYSSSYITKKWLDRNNINVEIPQEDFINLTHVFRTVGKISPCCNRIEDICRNWNIQTTENETVHHLSIFVGEGVGSTSYAFLKQYKNAVVLWNTKIDHRDPISPISMDDPDTSSRIWTTTTRMSLEDNLLDSQTIDSLIKSAKHVCNLVFCDATPYDIEKDKVLHMYCNIIKLAINVKPSAVTGLCFIRTNLKYWREITDAITLYQDQIFLIEYFRPIGSSHITDLFVAIHIVMSATDNVKDIHRKGKINSDSFFTLSHYVRRLKKLIDIIKQPPMFLNIARMICSNFRLWPSVTPCFESIASEFGLRITDVFSKNMHQIALLLIQKLADLHNASADLSTIEFLTGTSSSSFKQLSFRQLMPKTCKMLGFLFMKEMFTSNFNVDRSSSSLLIYVHKKFHSSMKLGTPLCWFPNMKDQTQTIAHMSFNRGIFCCMNVYGITDLNFIPGINNIEEQEIAQMIDDMIQNDVV